MAPRRNRSSSCGGSARANPSHAAAAAALVATANRSAAAGLGSSAPRRTTVRPRDSITLWDAVTADSVVAEIRPVAMAWSIVRRGCSPGSNEGPTDAAAANNAARSGSERFVPSQPRKSSDRCFVLIG